MNIIHLQILMNVLKVRMVVLRLAQMQLGTTHAPVTLATIWQMTDICVMVSFK